MDVEIGKVYLFTKSGNFVRVVESWTPDCRKLRARGPWWIVARVDTGKQMVAPSSGLFLSEVWDVEAEALIARMEQGGAKT